MTDEFEDRLRDLVTTAGRPGTLPAAAELRRRGDRRRRTRQVLGGALAILVIAGGVSVGTGRFQAAPTPPAAPTVVPTDPPPTSTPAPTQRLVASDLSGLYENGLPGVDAPVALAAPAQSGRRYLRITAQLTIDAAGDTLNADTRFFLRPARTTEKVINPGVVTLQSADRSEGGVDYCVQSDVNTGTLALKVCRPGETAQSFTLGPQSPGVFTIEASGAGALTVKGATVDITLDEAYTNFTVVS